MSRQAPGWMGRRIGGGGALLLLLVPLSLNIAQLLHGRSLVWGESMWPGYAKVRQAWAAEQLAAAPSSPAPAHGAVASGAAASAGTPAQVAAAAGVAAKDEALIDDLLAEDAPAAAAPSAAFPAEATPTAAGPAAASPTDASATAAAESDDLLADLDAPTPPAAAGSAGAAAAAAVALPTLALTDSQRAFCRVEHLLGQINQLGVAWMPLLMALILMFTAVVTTLRRHHIVLRDATNAGEDRVSVAAQLGANALVSVSAYHSLAITSGLQQTVQQVWMFGMASLAVINLWQLAKPVRAADAAGEETRLGKMLAAIPLYAYMAVISGAYFLLIEGHPAGISIYLEKITAVAILYVQVGLYLWTGILLRDTSLGQLIFDLLRPLRLPPELFAVLVVVLAAVPTAYSGASGILVLALGATMFTELRRSGLSQQRAIAATAMSGSLGVVLPPCLLVVIVASMNLDVTTDELYHWGWRVFAVSVSIFGLVSFLRRSTPWTIQPGPNAMTEILAAGRRLLPYALIAGSVIAFFNIVLDAPLDEHTAPYVLPVAMVALIPWDRRRNRYAERTGDGPVDNGGTLRATSLDTGTHIGALLILMGLSACLGGVIERSEIVELFPHELGSPFYAMALVMCALVLIGMIMDPYGAVILVSVTLYPIAKANGIHPINFWMVALVSFELGYLTPPVALNQLLTRQVVLSTAAFDPNEAELVGGTFMRRHEGTIVPVLVMLLTLVIVSFGPLLWGVRA